MGSGEDGQVVSRLVSKVATLEAAAGQAEAQRRSLHNQLVELRGNVSTLPFGRIQFDGLLAHLSKTLHTQERQ